MVGESPKALMTFPNTMENMGKVAPAKRIQAAGQTFLSGTDQRTHYYSAVSSVG